MMRFVLSNLDTPDRIPLAGPRTREKQGILRETIFANGALWGISGHVIVSFGDDTIVIFPEMLRGKWNGGATVDGGQLEHAPRIYRFGPTASLHRLGLDVFLYTSFQSVTSFMATFSQTCNEARMAGKLREEIYERHDAVGVRIPIRIKQSCNRRILGLPFPQPVGRTSLIE